MRDCNGTNALDYIEEFGKYEFSVCKRFQCLRFLEQWVHKTKLFDSQFKEILLPHLLLNIIPDKRKYLESYKSESNISHNT